MVIELRIKNFLSFKEETTISFEASKDRFFAGHYGRRYPSLSHRYYIWCQRQW